MVTATFPQKTLILCALLAGAAILLVTRPRPTPRSLSQTEGNSASCFSNLSQISRAVALYSRDFDGKIPRGVDPEDHFNSQNWSYSDAYGSVFREDARSAPFLHHILRPYVAKDTVFHCPADSGWLQTRLPGGPEAKLRDVLPSSFAKYGTSYYYSTILGFQLESAADIENPSQRLLLFDGDLWHSNGKRDSLNGLFLDGHVQNLRAAEFEVFSRE